MTLELTDKEIYLLRYVLAESISGISSYYVDEDLEYCSEPLPLWFTDEDIETAKDVLLKLNNNNADIVDFVDKVIELNTAS